MLKKALFYLGLASDEEYERYEDRSSDAQLNHDYPHVAPSGPQGQRQGPGSATVRPIRPIETNNPNLQPAASTERHRNRNFPNQQDNAVAHGASAVRIVDDPPTRPANLEPQTISPISFEQAPMIGEYLRSGQPLIINFQNAERNDRRRLLDFVTGGCYALGGKMKRVGDLVFLVTQPENPSRTVEQANSQDQNIVF